MKCLSIHVTDLCNSACSFCVVGSPLYTRDSIDYGGILSFLSEHAGQGYQAVNLHGGEATIHPKFDQLIDFINELGYPEIHLQTNAIKLANPALTESLIRRRVTKFIISLHGHSPEMHDSQTGTKGGYLKTLEGIRHAKKGGSHVRTNTVITTKNLNSLPDLCRLACELGVDHINLSNMHPVGSAFYSRTSSMPRFTNMRPLLAECVDVVTGNGRVFTLEGFPYCVVGDFVSYQLNEENRQIKMLMRGHVITDYDMFMSDAMRIFGAPCKECSVRRQCGGVYPQYIEYNGWSEFCSIPKLTSDSPALQTHEVA